MTVAYTSVIAYEEHKNSGKVGLQAMLIFNNMEENKDYSRRELSELTGIELSSICGRVNEMLKIGMVEEADPRPCQFTQKTIKPVKKANYER